MGEPGQADAEPRAVRFALSERQRVAWLRLYRTDNVGPATFRDLINHCGSAERALAMLPELSTRGGRRRYPQIPSAEDAQAEIDGLAAIGARLVGIGEADYPDLLRLVEHAPPLIAVKGEPAALHRPAISIVGSRNASMAGLTMARRLAGDLGAGGHVIVSGLARGIDGAAHEAALATGTIAVLAGGIDRPYPPQNAQLLDRIASGGAGCAVTEMPLGWEPRARDFPRRNRIIAGLSLGLVVVEAAARSGSLISARLAGEMGRIVMAVPGSPLDPRAHGTNMLIRDGATLVTGAADVREALAPLDGAPAPPEPRSALEPEGTMTVPPDDDARARLVSLLGPTPTAVDDLIAETGLSASQVFLIVLELDLAERIERHSGNRISLVVGHA
ncbi:MULTISPECIES: DNA-processing protein DprA [unclassified Roseitalea]|uniref:DNA-processing protein DprA n=1 Tax=unclassified Roseitalea TaxID=2639107 RepID=UPI00273E058F|nr:MULTISPECIES: DNA-processing protein DprA [unclassified Roseitalea]